VITATGRVLKREDELINPKIKTGEIEVHCDELTVQSDAAVLPFLIAEDDGAPEAIRLKQRFLELRREKLHRNIVLRSQVINAIRREMMGIGFTEYQTPILTSSSPEGARDFIVPSRLHPGKFFALPQAPQQFKQLLMVAGFDRYFQIAPCFRDEDARADRSPGEFYQLDLEMSFVEQEDVLEANETVIHKVFTEFADGQEVTPLPFPRIAYDDVMNRYGSDKPDLRNPLEIEDVSEVFADCGFQVFTKVIAEGGSVRAIKVPLDAVPPRKYFDDTIDWFKKMTGQGIAYLSYENGEWRSSIKKFFNDDELEALRRHLNIEGTTTVFFGAGPNKKVLPWLGKLREKLGQDFEKIEQGPFKFCWITDYPMYETDEHTGKLEFGHNPFSMPQGGLEALENEDPETIKANQYDIVCNGYELGSGAIRNHVPEIMYKAFSLVGYSQEDVDREFGGMIRAFQFGAPPHGGFAHGLERIVMLLAREEAIRDVITFPLAQTGEDLLMSAPSELSEAQLKDVHIRVELPAEMQLKMQAAQGE
jgi:aspartyl-tRNA synthetase